MAYVHNADNVTCSGPSAGWFDPGGAPMTFGGGGDGGGGSAGCGGGGGGGGC